MTHPIPDNRQPIIDALHAQVQRLNEQQRRTQAAIETCVRDCVAAMGLDAGKGWLIQAGPQGWALVEQETEQPPHDLETEKENTDG